MLKMAALQILVVIASVIAIKGYKVTYITKEEAKEIIDGTKET